MSLSMYDSFSDVVEYVGSQVHTMASQVGDFCMGRGRYQVYWENFNYIAEKVENVVKKVFIVLVSGALMMANPGFFTISFVIGFAFDEKVREILDRVEPRIRAQPWPLIVAAGCAAWVSLPISVAVISSVWALHWGSVLSSQGGRQVEGGN